MKAKILKRQILLFLFFGLTFLPHAAKAENEVIRIGGSHVLSILPLLAIEQGFFEKQNLNVEFERIRVGKLTMDALLSKNIDFGSVVDTNLAINSFRESELTAIAITLSDYDNGFAFLPGKVNAKAKSSFEALKGKRIGYLPATTSHFLLMSYLEAVSWSFKDIRAIPLQPASMLPALRTGAVDAVSIWNPWRYKILKSLGTKVKEIPNTAGVYRPMAYLATRREVLKKRPDSVKKLFLALLEAKDYARANPKKVRARYAEWNGMDNEALESVWSRIQIRLDFENDGVAAVKRDIELIKKFDMNFTKRKSRAVNSFFDFSTLKKVSNKELASE